MKTIQKQLIQICLLFTLLIFIQSCRVYNNKPVSIEQAVKEEKRIKIKTIDKKILKFKKIVIENDKFYGISNKGVMTEININNLKKIKTHNKTLSIVLGILVPILTISAIFAIGLSN